MFIVWTPAAILAAVTGGALFGWLIVARFHNPRFDAVQTAGAVAILWSMTGVIFYTAQAIETLFADGEMFAWRVVSRFGLFLLFVAATALGTGVGIRLQRGGWRTPSPSSTTEQDIAQKTIDLFIERNSAIARMGDAISDNTRLIQKASDSADAAFEAANDMNEKIAVQGDALLAQGEAQAATSDAVGKMGPTVEDTHDRVVDIHERTVQK